MFDESASGGPWIWSSFSGSSGVGPCDVPLRYASASISDFGSRIFDYIDDIELNSSDFAICSLVPAKLSADFHSAIRNPHSAIIDPVARPPIFVVS
jgi:hypothetical protein